jgi:glycosyltransferase involved in cell wall biosynthesis/peptidoglycan/xylan/chitin deacetylase (PgdA/CDA1 family)
VDGDAASGELPVPGDPPASADLPAPAVTVVIPTFQRRDVVVESVRALAGQTGIGLFEAIVVVDGATDGTADALRELALPFPLRVLEQTNLGASAARNHGAQAARGELLLFLDDDMEADPSLIAQHLRSHAEGADVVLGHIPLHPDSPDSFLAQSVGEWAERRYEELSRDGVVLDEIMTGQMSMARDLFLALGGFDLDFTRGGTFGCEDLELGRRISKGGYKIVFNPRAVSRQRYVVTPRRHLKNYRQAGAARVMMSRKNPDEVQSILFRRERLADRLLWRRLRVPLREIVLALLAAGLENERTIYWFRRVRDLEYFAGVREAGGAPARRPVRVLCYHSISDLGGAGPLEPYGVPPAEFRRQLKFLSRRFRFIDAAELRAFLDGSGVPRRALLITFDDCFRDLLDEALPVLREAHAGAIGFAVSGLTGGTNDWDREISDKRLRLLDFPGLCAIADGGVAVGTHTRTHRMLTCLAPAELAEEIQGSLTELERGGLRRPEFLAYPYGGNDAAVQRAAADAGLAGAFTTRPGFVRPGADRFAMPRIEILRSDRGLRFIWKVATGRGLSR